MMNQIVYISLLVTMSFFSVQVEDSDFLMRALSQELFEKGKETQYLYQQINCPNHNLDSTIKVSIQQPNPEKVLSLLGKIMNTKDANAFNDLKAVYTKHINNFSREWSKAYIDNFYACEQIQEQFNILKGFETALKALDFQHSNLTSKQIFDFYIEESLLNQKLLADIKGRDELIQNYKVYSEDFRNINKKAWFGGEIPFHYLDPFINDLEPYFIELLEGCNWNLKSETNYCAIVWSSSRVYMEISDQRVSDYFRTNFDSWKSNYRHSFIYSYAGTHFIPELTTLLVQDWIKKDSLNKPIYRQYQMSLLLKNKHNFPIVMNLLLEASDKQPEHTTALLKFIPRAEAIKKINIV